METFLQQLVFGISNGMNIALVAVGLALVFGVYKTLNLAHGAVFMLGAFTAYVVSSQGGWPFFVGLVAAMLAMGVLGVVMEAVVFRPLRRRPLTDQLLASLGIFLALTTLALRIWGDFQARAIRMPGEGSTIVLAGVRFDAARMLTIAITLVLFGLLYLLVYRTHLGRTMRAMAQDEEAATLMGVHTGVVASATFFVGSAFGGAAGALLGALFNARPDMGFRPLLLALAVVIFGGLGSMGGAVIAGLVVGVLQTLSVFYIDTTVGDLLPFVTLLAVLLVRPQGLFGQRVARA